MSVIDDVATLIKDRIQDLDNERRKLEKALQQFGGTPVKRRGRDPGSKSKGGAKRKRRGRGSKRSGPGRKEQVLAQIKANPSIKTTQIGKNVGIASTQVSNLVTKLKKAGALEGSSGKWTVSES